MVNNENLEAVEVKFLKVGTVLAGTVFDAGGKELWLARKPFTHRFIESLKQDNLDVIYYTPPKYKEKSNKPPIFSEESLDFAYQAVDEIVTHISYSKPPDFNLAKQTIEKFAHDLEDHPSGFLNLMVLKDYDTYTYTHSINVGLTAMFLTKKLGFNHIFIKEVGIGGFLHDMGKIKVPSRIVNKEDQLTEEEFKIMKNHPVYGFKMVQNDETLSTYVKKIILFHHEKWQGGGYPLNIREEAIGNFAQIVSVSDVFDALTTERSYKKPFSINDALLYVMRNTPSHFAPFISQRFINEIAMMNDLGSFYPVGGFVMLNTGETAYISKKNQEYSMRPEILILKNSKGLPMRTPIKVELKRDVDRSISHVIDNPEEIETLSYLLS